MSIVQKNWLKQIICHHDFKSFTKKSMFHALNGETVYRICVKCGKERGSYFREFEGNGYK